MRDVTKSTKRVTNRKERPIESYDAIVVLVFHDLLITFWIDGARISKRTQTQSAPRLFDPGASTEFEMLLQHESIDKSFQLDHDVQNGLWHLFSLRSGFAWRDGASNYTNEIEHYSEKWLKSLLNLCWNWVAQ
jgi:hypothetical protein